MSPRCRPFYYGWLTVFKSCCHGLSAVADGCGPRLAVTTWYFDNEELSTMTDRELQLERTVRQWADANLQWDPSLCDVKEGIQPHNPNHAGQVSPCSQRIIRVPVFTQSNKHIRRMFYLPTVTLLIGRWAETGSAYAHCTSSISKRLRNSIAAAGSWLVA